MKYRQQIAFDNPAFWFTNAGLFTLRKDEPQANGLTLTTTVCVDAFDDTTEWHAQAALQFAPQKFLEFVHFTPDLQRELIRVCLQLLDSVGEQATTRAEFSAYAMHIKRRVTDLELQGIANRRFFVTEKVEEIGHWDGISREQAMDEFRFDPLANGLGGGENKNATVSL
jgi:hypothetical protein